MKQVLQNLKTGITEVTDVPCPRAGRGQLLIRTSHTLVSAGTERMLVDFGKGNFIDKARQQPDKLRLVLDKVRTDGLMPTLEAVRNSYALLAGKPGRSLVDIYAQHLESPGTKAYSEDEARKLFARFSKVEIETVLTHGDLLASAAGQRHRGPMLTIAKALWPRWLIRRLLPRHQLFLLARSTK